MKKTFLILIMLFMAVRTCGDAGQGILPVGSPWDFGVAKKGDVKKKTFFIENTSRETVVIKKVHTCCGYSVDDISTWELAPGEKSTVIVTCDTQRKYAGEDIKYITIDYSPSDGEALKIPVKVLVSDK